MKQSLIAIAITLLTSNLCAELVREHYDIAPLIATDSEGYAMEASGHGTSVSNGKSGVTRRTFEIGVDGKALAKREETFEPPFEIKEAEANNSGEIKTKKKK